MSKASTARLRKNAEIIVSMYGHGNRKPTVAHDVMAALSDYDRAIDVMETIVKEWDEDSVGCVSGKNIRLARQVIEEAGR